MNPISLRQIGSSLCYHSSEIVVNGSIARLTRRRLLSSSTSGSSGRAQLPPMPRVPPPLATGASESTSAASVQTPKKRGGGVLIGTGWILLGILAVDQFLQYTDKKEAKETIAALMKEEDEARKEFFDTYKDKPVLHEAIVKFEYKMSGTRGLKGVSLDERLEVVEEGVGTNGTYATCRRRDPNTGEILSIGWYPLSFMEKVEKPRQKFLGLF